MFNYPIAIVANSQGNLLVWDDLNARIRKIKTNIIVTTFAGGGNQATGTGTNVGFAGSHFSGITIDRNDTISMFHDFGLYRIPSSAIVTRTNIPLLSPQGICADSAGSIYIADADANKIYRCTTNGGLNVFAGSGNSGYTDGNGIFTSFKYPTTLAADSADNIYVWDSQNKLIRRIDQNQNVTTFAGKYGGNLITDGVGTNAGFDSIAQMCFDNFGNLILAADTCIRKVSATTNVVTVAGIFTDRNYSNGVGNVARFSLAYGVCFTGGTIYVADSSNQRIRSITNNPSAEPVLPANLQLNTYPGLQIVGTVGRTYQIQSAPDMNTWTTRATVLLNSNSYLWIDQNPVSGNKFYRAVLLP